MSATVFTMPTNPAVFGRVAVVLGGDSAEREVSLDSGGGVLQALRARGIDATPYDGTAALLEAVADKLVDRVFIILHGRGGEDGTLQGALHCMGVPYTGSSVLGSALAMDKVRTKQLWQALGLPTPRFAVVDAGKDLSRTRSAPTEMRGEDPSRTRSAPTDSSGPGAKGEGRCGSGSHPRPGGARDLDAQVAAAIAHVGYPAIVKPSHEGSSVGITRVHGERDVAAAIDLATRYDGELLIEQLIEGDEFTVAVLADEALPSIRIVPAGEYYDYHAKYVAEDTQYLCPGADGDEEAALRTLARQAFDAVGCSGWGRVDLMRDRAGQPWLLEVNTAPGMTSHSLVPKAAAAIGIDYPELCWRILAQTLPGNGSAA